MLQASKKGASPTVVGLIFGVFQLTLFLTSPLFGTFVSNPSSIVDISQSGVCMSILYSTEQQRYFISLFEKVLPCVPSFFNVSPLPISFCDLAFEH